MQMNCSSSALTLTIFADAMERSMEHDILKFTLQVNGVISKVHTFEYNSEEEVYLAEAKEALSDFTSAMLDSYFDPITIRYDGWASMERQWMRGSRCECSGGRHTTPLASGLR